jgi:superfamily II DNA/RNA helicase
MADMGFMPQVQKILYRMETDHQTMLFSATLDGAVKQLVNRYMHDPVFHEVQSDEPTVEEMEHRFLYVHDMDKVRVAAAIARGANRTLMFCNTKRMADKLVRELRKEGVKAAPIHGDLGQAARERSLADFTAGKVPVLVAPTSRRAASTSTRSTSSSTTTRPTTTRPTSTVPDARHAPARQASRSR